MIALITITALFILIASIIVIVDHLGTDAYVQETASMVAATGVIVARTNAMVVGE
jgi:hypothetical protein